MLWSLVVVVFATMCCPAKGKRGLPVVAAKLSVLRHAVQLSMACGPVRIRTRLPALSGKPKLSTQGVAGRTRHAVSAHVLSEATHEHKVQPWHGMYDAVRPGF